MCSEMGQKKDTLLRWVNCCSDAATTVERIKNLADGWFFIHILKFLRSHPTDGTDPWLQIINILRGVYCKIANELKVLINVIVCSLFTFQNTNCKKTLLILMQLRLEMKMNWQNSLSFACISPWYKSHVKTSKRRQCGISPPKIKKSLKLFFLLLSMMTN